MTKRRRLGDTHNELGRTSWIGGKGQKRTHFTILGLLFLILSVGFVATLVTYESIDYREPFTTLSLHTCNEGDYPLDNYPSSITVNESINSLYVSVSNFQTASQMYKLMLKLSTKQPSTKEGLPLVGTDVMDIGILSEHEMILPTGINHVDDDWYPENGNHVWGPNLVEFIINTQAATELGILDTHQTAHLVFELWKMDVSSEMTTEVLQPPGVTLYSPRYEYSGIYVSLEIMVFS